MTTQRYPQNRRPAVPGADRRPQGSRTPSASRRGAGTAGARRPAGTARGSAPVRRAGAPGPGRPGPGRRPARSRPRGWRAIPAKLRLALCALALAAAVFGIIRLAGSVREAQIERFMDNVYVNGVNLAGYTFEEGLARMAQERDSRLNAVYTLTYGDQSWSFSPSDYNFGMEYQTEMEYAWNLGHVGDGRTRRQVAENLKQAPAQFNSEITYDEAALKAFVDGIGDQVDVEPVDAEVAITEEKPVIITASRNGFKLDREKTLENLSALILTGEGDTRLPVEEVRPAIVSDNMEMRVIAKFSTDVSFRGADSRSNVRLALSFFNGYVVYPGDTCDFNQVVGPRTEGRGFKEAPEYAGNELKKGYGGGVCQASTTLYDAAIMANMTILERHNHNMTVSYVEPSQDAAVEYGDNGKNFVFRNDTEHAIYIYTNVDRENATVTIYGTRPEYHYELASVIIEEKKSNRKRYEYDYDGKNVYYITDSPKLKTKGHGSCRSEGWLVAYDWDTKQEVSREQISYDVYTAGVNVYWRGVHDSKGNVVDPKAEAEEGT